MPQDSKHWCFIAPNLHYYILDNNQEQVGGREVQQYLIAQRLLQRGESVSVITSKVSEESHYTSSGINVHEAIPQNSGKITFVKKVLLLFRAMSKIDADVYYVRGHLSLCVIASVLCSLLQKEVIFCVASDTNVDPSYLSELPKTFISLYISSLKWKTQVVCLTDHQQKVLEDEFGINSKVIPCGYEIPEEDKLVKTNERSHILWVGRLDRDQKKPKRFLELARDLPKLNFLMIGSRYKNNPEFYDEIEEKANNISNLEFKGFVHPDNIDKYFRDAVVLVNTSDYEGFGNVFLEAWRYATPVISLKYSISGLIQSESIGYVSRTMDQMESDIETLYNNTEKRKKFGQNARELADRSFSIESVTNSYFELIR